MNSKEKLKKLIEQIKTAKGWTQQKVSVEAGYKARSLTQAVSKPDGHEPVIDRLKIVFRDVLENPTHSRNIRMHKVGGAVGPGFQEKSQNGWEMIEEIKGIKGYLKKISEIIEEEKASIAELKKELLKQKTDEPNLKNIWDLIEANSRVLGFVHDDQREGSKQNRLLSEEIQKMLHKDKISSSHKGGK